MPYIVKTVSAKAPKKSYDLYKRLYILEVQHGITADAVTACSNKCVLRTVLDSGPLHVGKTAQSAYYRKLAQYEQECSFLNAMEKEPRT